MHADLLYFALSLAHAEAAIRNLRIRNWYEAGHEALAAVIYGWLATTYGFPVHAALI